MTTVSYHVARLAVAPAEPGPLPTEEVSPRLKESRCERCGLAEWRGRPLTVALHHINGDRHDNRLENLQLLCRNCHSQTDNFAGRNGRGRNE